MTTNEIDLDRYLERIGYQGELAPTLETLRNLHLQHVQAIAFESLNPWLGWPVALDLASLQQKLVSDRRGGYCFEQNLLFSHVLRSVGFTVTGLAARVLWNEPEDAITPRSHMLLKVEIDGRPYVADVGFGGQTLTGPLRLEPDLAQETPHEPFRLLKAGVYLTMQARIGKEWRTLYRFDLLEQFVVDYEVSNYYLSTHPRSHFRNNLIVARPAPRRRYALFNNRLAVHHVGGPTERQALTSAAEIRRTLEEVFDLAVPRVPELDEALERIARQRP